MTSASGGIVAGPAIGLFTSSSLVEVELLLASFVLCSLIGLERQFRQKAAGYRTHVLVGLGACAFTLVSVFGFSAFLGDTSIHFDVSRIAAQVVTGIGFLGAGVIFKGRNMVRGLTTAATVWVSAAVGMACGAGMLSLAILVTILHLITLFVVAPLVRRLPNTDSNKLVRITYEDGLGILREIMAIATSMQFASLVVDSRKLDPAGGQDRVQIDVKFEGRPSLHLLLPEIMEIKGVHTVSLRRDTEHSVDDDGDSL